MRITEFHTDRTPHKNMQVCIEQRGKDCESVWPRQKPIKILAIGNSFSEDAMRWLYELAVRCGGTEVTLANLYIGGCSLQRHVDNIHADAKAYDYQKISRKTGGVWEHSGEFSDQGGNPFSIRQGLMDEDWDFITLQQVSGFSGDPSTFTADGVDLLSLLVDYVRSARPSARLGWHMTWAYQQDSDHAEFARYGSKQETMYRAIVSTVQDTVLRNPHIQFVIPSGTAIQNLRTSFLGDILTRDGYHLSYYLGRYAASLTWLRRLTGWTAGEADWTPDENELPRAYLPVIREAVEGALACPFAITPSAYQTEP